MADKKLAVFSIKKSEAGTVWVRAGSAYANKDGSMNVYLDVLPLDGKLHVREAGERKDGVVNGFAARAESASGGDMASLAGGH